MDTSVKTVRADPTVHPSSPIPVQGPGVGSRVRVRLGDTGLETFPLILGAAEFGWHIDEQSSQAVLDRYREFGGNAVHVADSYSAGRSEYIVGRWMAQRAARDESVLIVRVGKHPDHPGLGPVALVRAVEASLTRLGTDRIDVLSLDGAADSETPLDETLSTVEWLVESGKVRHVGAAGFTPERLVEARILVSAGYPRISVLDTHYNVLHRTGYEGDLRLVAGAQGLAVTPSHPLEHGFLSGRHRHRPRTALSARGAQLAASLNRRGQRILRALDSVAAQGAVPDAAVAVAWLLAQRSVVAPIVNAFAADQVDELVQGVGFPITRAHLAELARAAQ